MAKKDKDMKQDDVLFDVEAATGGDDQHPADVGADDGQESAGDDKEQTAADKKERLKETLKQMSSQAREGDEAPSASLRFRDVLGGDFLWALVRRQLWLIILIVLIVTAYVAVRYQCQQDAIDIAQLEKDLEGAKFESLSSSSNLTRMSRQSNIEKMLEAADSTGLHPADQPPYIIDVPAE